MSGYGEALSPVLRSHNPDHVSFWCPGCDSVHSLSVGGAGAVWGWNRNAERPTFTPSVLFRSGHHVPGQEGRDCWCTYTERTGRPLPRGVECGVCHSFVTDGRIQFLGDCTHALAGQTVDLPEFDR